MEASKACSSEARDRCMDLRVKVVVFIFCCELWQGRCRGRGECGDKLLLIVWRW